MKSANKITYFLKYVFTSLSLLLIIAVNTVFFRFVFHNLNMIYVSANGNDASDGSFFHPYRTIQFAADHAILGKEIRILPGKYRESVVFHKSGTLSKPLKISVSNNDKSKVEVLGSEPASDFIWNKCTSDSCSLISDKIRSNVYFTKLDWQEIPNQIYAENKDNKATELIKARTPNFSVTTDWKYSEHWWTAEDSVENQHILKDHKLNKYDDLNNATINMIDGGERCGQFLWSRIIDNYNQNRSEIIFKDPLGFSIFGSQENGISKYTKYFIENNSQFLDSPGEWFYDQTQKQLYIWPLEENNPKNFSIEIARRSVGFDLSKTSNIEIDGISFRYFNEDRNKAFETTGAIVINPNVDNPVQNISVQNSDINSSVNGISLFAPDHRTTIKNIKLNKLIIEKIVRSDFTAIGSNEASPNISDISVSNSTIQQSGFHYNDIAINLKRVDNVQLDSNRITDNANYGIHYTSFEKNESPVENILIENNFVDNNCLGLSSCSAIKMYGGNYKNTVLRKNIMSNNRGWSYCQETKGGNGFAHGLFISNASGITAIGNQSFNNSSDAFHVFPRQLIANNNSFIRNTARNSYIGLDLLNPEGLFDYDQKVRDSRHDNTIIQENTFENNKIGIFLDPANPKSIKMNNNLFIQNGIDLKYRKVSINGVPNINSQFPYWENQK